MRCKACGATFVPELGKEFEQELCPNCRKRAREVRVWETRRLR